mmetsp:Transcript_23674/g.47073  ORF Transcript_23674/g.47073 Transcript_23674/m.47073 type:complete len:228 (-) Transcript_23674:1099-1782(-)
MSVWLMPPPELAAADFLRFRPSLIPFFPSSTFSSPPCLFSSSCSATIFATRLETFLPLRSSLLMNFASPPSPSSSSTSSSLKKSSSSPSPSFMMTAFLAALFCVTASCIVTACVVSFTLGGLRRAVVGLIDLGCESPLPPPPPPPPPEGATSFAGEGSLLACPEDGPGELCLGGATGEGAFASSSPRRSSAPLTSALGSGSCCCAPWSWSCPPSSPPPWLVAARASS